MVKRLTNPFRAGPPPLGSLLTAAGQRLSAELDSALLTAGFADLRASHAAVFMAVEPQGSRLTDLAEQTRMTKQAAGELVRYLVEHGYFTMASDPADGRAKRVLLTERGWEAIEAGEKVISSFNQWLNQVVGAAQVARLRQVLTLIAESNPRSREPGMATAQEPRGGVGRAPTHPLRLAADLGPECS